MSKKKKYVEMPLDLDPKLVCRVIKLHAKNALSKESYSFVKESIKKRNKKDLPLDVVFEAFGRAMFNELLITATLDFIAWKDCWPPEEEEDDNQSPESD